MTDHPSGSMPGHVEEYQLIRALGRSSMGRVYLASETVGERQVVIKFMDALDANEASRDRFLSEANAIAKLSHPNIATVYRVGQVDGRPYLVSEYIAGRSLEQVGKPVRSEEVLRIGIGAARGLAAAHRSGVLHRDLKPANVMLADDGGIKLVDFGLAKLLELSPDIALAGLSGEQAMIASMSGGSLKGLASTDEQPPASASSLPPQAGAVNGLPAYIAPEIWNGEPASCRSDVYSLGALLYELCSGRRPHEATSILALAHKVRSQNAAPLHDLAPAADAKLAEIIDRCLQHSPQARFESGEALTQALESPASPSSQPSGILAAIGRLFGRRS